jgi:cation diffusion facilitator family transporter
LIGGRRHAHKFGQQCRTEGERRTIIVIVITSVMMVIEIAAGIAYGSMALLADGLHMGSHTAALGLAVFAYVHARRHANDERYSFGTGKVNALAGFTGAVVLAGFAVVMAIESFERFLNPVTIIFNYAIVVAVAGLVVNGFSMVVLGGHHSTRRRTAADIGST